MKSVDIEIIEQQIDNSAQQYVWQLKKEKKELTEED